LLYNLRTADMMGQTASLARVQDNRCGDPMTGPRVFDPVPNRDMAHTIAAREFAHRD